MWDASEIPFSELIILLLVVLDTVPSLLVNTGDDWRAVLIQRYADDSNLFSCCPRILEIMLHELQKEARRFHLELNVGKTWLICVGAARAQPTHLRNIDGCSIQEADSHNTLGFKIGQTDRVSAQVRRRGGRRRLRPPQSACWASMFDSA